jgi:hypothetical protein
LAFACAIVSAVEALIAALAAAAAGEALSAGADNVGALNTGIESPGGNSGGASWSVGTTSTGGGEAIRTAACALAEAATSAERAASGADAGKAGENMIGAKSGCGGEYAGIPTGGVGSKVTENSD